VRAIARTPDGDALFPVGGTGALAVYATVTLDRSAMRWSLHRVDVASGVTKRLVSRRVAQDRPPPQAVLDGRRVVWQTFPRRLTGVPRGPLDTVDVVTGRTSRLVDDLPGLLVTVTRAGIVMRAGDPPGAPDDGRVSAAVYVPETGETRVLSPVPVVDGLVADDATAVWQASVTPGYGVWGTPVRGDGTPRQYHDGAPPTGPSAGASWPS
jgi:hypothetical protein